MTEFKQPPLSEFKLRRKIWEKFKGKLTDKPSSITWLAIIVSACIFIEILLLYFVITFPLIELAYHLACSFPILALFAIPSNYIFNKFVWIDQDNFRNHAAICIFMMGIFILGFSNVTEGLINGFVSAIALDTFFLFAILGDFLFHKRFKGAGLLYLRAKQLLSILEQKAKLNESDLKEIEELFKRLTYGFDEWGAEAAHIRIKNLYELQELGISKIIFEYSHIRNKFSSYFNEAFFSDLEKRYGEKEFAEERLNNFFQFLDLNLIGERNTYATSIYRYMGKKRLVIIIAGVVITIFALMADLFSFFPF
jgi:hypothetical protein